MKLFGFGTSTKKCTVCGAKKKYKPIKWGTHVFATEEETAPFILQCLDCGEFACFDCATKGAGSVYVGDQKVLTKLRCPGCGGDGVTLPQM